MDKREQIEVLQRLIAAIDKGGQPSGFPGNPPDDSGDWVYSQTQGHWVLKPQPVGEAGDLLSVADELFKDEVAAERDRLRRQLDAVLAECNRWIGVGYIENSSAHGAFNAATAIKQAAKQAGEKQ